MLALLQTEVKRRRDSIAELKTVDRPQLLADEQAELAALLDYLPKQLSREQSRKQPALSSPRLRDRPGAHGRLMKQLTAQLKVRPTANSSTRLCANCLRRNEALARNAWLLR